mgnify:CR=1 FL=1
MAEGFGQYVGTGTARTKELQRKIAETGATDPEDIMMLIMEVFKEEVLYPEPGKFYTFIYNPKTPDIEYDQHPLIACTSLERWGFKGLNFHWRQGRQYTWEELGTQVYIVQQEELDDLLSLRYGLRVLNK